MYIRPYTYTVRFIPREVAHAQSIKSRVYTLHSAKYLGRSGTRSERRVGVPTLR